MQVTIEIINGADIEAKLQRLGPSLMKLDDAMRQIGEYMATYFGNQAFTSQGQVFGAAWPRLNLKYSIWKAKHFPGRRPEIRTGTMKNSFAYSSGSTTVAIGNNAPYFKYQNDGTSRGLPARQMIGFNSANKRRVATILVNELRRKIDNV